MAESASTPMPSHASTNSAAELALMDAWWRAANYLSIGQIYLLDNPLLKEPLELKHIKPRLLGHWGTTPGLNFVYVHLNRVIKSARARHALCRRSRPRRSRDCRQYLARGHVQRILPACPAERGWHAAPASSNSAFPAESRATWRQKRPARSTRAASSATPCRMPMALFSTIPDLVVACVVGDGEAETGPMATSWHSNKFLNPVTDGAVLPILHLNGYKIANPIDSGADRCRRAR